LVFVKSYVHGFNIQLHEFRRVVNDFLRVIQRITYISLYPRITVREASGSLLNAMLRNMVLLKHYTEVYALLNINYCCDLYSSEFVNQLLQFIATR
jgi:hypothetical protein